MNLPIEKQVTSLELSKRLEKLGVPQNGLFFWYRTTGLEPNQSPRLIGNGEITVKNASYCFRADEFDELFSAFTVAELGEMLPFSINKNRKNKNTWWDVVYVKTLTDLWVVVLTDPTYQKIMHKEIAETEADARAKILIYLIENKLVKVEEL